MRKVGRIYSADVSGRFLLILFVFAAIFATAGVTAINRYVDLYFENQALKLKIARLSRSLDEYQFQSQVLNQYNQLVSELNKVEQNGPDTPGEAPGDQPPAADGAQAAAEPPADSTATAPAETAPADAVAQDNGPEPAAEVRTPENSPVDAVELNLTPENKNTVLNFKFRLSNVTETNKSIAGYLVVVLVNNKVDPPVLASYPDVSFKDGLPADYRQGTQFSISYGKTVRGKITKLTRAQDFTQAWIYVYSQDGKLILRKLLNSEHG